jgi:hypothetical protein
MNIKLGEAMIALESDNMERDTVVDVDVGGGRIVRFRVRSTCWKCVQRSEGKHPASIIIESESLGVNENGELGYAVVSACPGCLHRESVAFWIMGMDEMVPGSVIIPEAVE